MINVEKNEVIFDEEKMMDGDAEREKNPEENTEQVKVTDPKENETIEKYSELQETLRDAKTDEEGLFIIEEMKNLERKVEEINEKEKVIEMVKNSGFKELIEKTSKLSDSSFEESIPIPIEKMSESNFVISKISPNVKEVIDIYSEVINEKETAKEYPFLLSGKTSIDERGNKLISIEEIDMLYDSGLKLENDVVFINEEILGKSVLESTNNGSDVLILCHTHPVVSEKSVDSSLHKKIDDETKKEMWIRDVGLNLSLQDMYQLYKFKKNLEDQREAFNLPENCVIALGVLMFNGEMNIINIEESTFRKRKIRSEDNLYK